jgi:uncharacterized damage-inducible protein DinB
MRDLVIGDVAHELAGTRRMLDRVPDDRLSWRPHEKSPSLGGLATHLVNLLTWQLMIAREPGFDLASLPQQREPLESRAALLEEFDGNAARLSQHLDGLDDDSLREEWTLRHGEQVISRSPRGLALRTFGISHMVHHRAQLGVYFRLLDVPVPGLYGPSADEPMA